VVVGKIVIPGLTDGLPNWGPESMVFVGDYIYLAAGDRLGILNNEDRGNPYLVGEMGFSDIAGE
jgi:hypothetical protein